MKKRKLAMSLAFLAAFGIESAAFAADNPFATVPQQHWSYEALSELVHNGLIDGYAEGDFKKDRLISRYEMAMLTAKAMSNIDKADAADKDQIVKLEGEFKDELTDMHVRIPGMAAPAVAAVPAVKKADPIQWSGNIRIRYDHKTDNTDKSGDSCGTGVKDTSYYYELTGKTQFGDGWGGLVRFLGAKDRDGQDRGGQENTNGQFDMSRLYVYGPVGPGILQVGRDKANEINSMVMNEYYTGLKYSFGNKMKVNFTYGSPDSASDTRDTVTDKYWVDDRGINVTNINPKNLGIDYLQLDMAYPLTEKTNIYAGFWHTIGKGKTCLIDTKGTATGEYENTNIGEIAFDHKIAKNLVVGADYDKSSRSTQNEAYNMSLVYRNADKNIPHSWSTELDYVHLEKNAYIKSTFDIKSNDYGRRGWQLIAKYVPTKNVLWTTRWLQSADLTGAEITQTKEKWLRTQIEYFF